jgi:DNA-binding response OmpR family regulator
MAKLLIIDDDQEFCQLLRHLMLPHGWTVEMAFNGSDGRQMLESFQYDVVLLDWTLPDGTGLNICREFRRSGKQTPIIFLTAMSDIDSKESGLDAGGDDYLIKPCDCRELLARIRSLRRRTALEKAQDDKLIIRGVCLHADSRTISNGQSQTTLSAIECQLLEYLFRHPNKVFSSAQLFEAVWPSQTESTDATVRVHMAAIRKKLASINAEGFVKTLHKSGYIIEDKTS